MAYFMCIPLYIFLFFCFWLKWVATNTPSLQYLQSKNQSFAWWACKEKCLPDLLGEQTTQRKVSWLEVTFPFSKLVYFVSDLPI